MVYLPVAKNNYFPDTHTHTHEHSSFEPPYERKKRFAQKHFFLYKNIIQFFRSVYRRFYYSQCLVKITRKFIRFPYILTCAEQEGRIFTKLLFTNEYDLYRSRRHEPRQLLARESFRPWPRFGDGVFDQLILASDRLSRLWPVFRECHHDRMRCMSLITKLHTKPDTKITAGESNRLKIWLSPTVLDRFLGRGGRFSSILNVAMTLWDETVFFIGLENCWNQS